jgi:hypothetical protein
MASSNACHLLLGALKVTPPETHPRHPFHGGGPPPKIDARSYVVAALWLADRISSQVDERDRATFDEWVGLARRQLVKGPEQASAVDKSKLVTAHAQKVSRIPCKIGVWAAHETHNWLTRPIYAGGAARPAAANYARFLLKKAPHQLPAFLEELDAQCIHLEALASVHERETIPSAPVATTLWRGHKDGKATHWLMRLDNGLFALLCKPKARWQLIEGDRDDVLASVSEDQFETAVNAVVGAASGR